MAPGLRARRPSRAAPDAHRSSEPSCRCTLGRVGRARPLVDGLREQRRSRRDGRCAGRHGHRTTRYRACRTGWGRRSGRCWIGLPFDPPHKRQRVYAGVPRVPVRGRPTWILQTARYVHGVGMERGGPDLPDPARCIDVPRHGEGCCRCRVRDRRGRVSLRRRFRVRLQPLLVRNLAVQPHLELRRAPPIHEPSLVSDDDAEFGNRLRRRGPRLSLRGVRWRVARVHGRNLGARAQLEHLLPAVQRLGSACC